MQRAARFVGALAGLAVLAVACSKVPYTGRKQYNIVPQAIMTSLGEQSFAQVTGQARLDRGEDYRILTEVGRRLSDVAEGDDKDWDFALIDDEHANAFALPGGNIAFYTGILPVLRNEAGMAFVMGHEVGHTLANHGAERLSQQLTLLGGLAGLELYLAGETQMNPEQRRMILGALGLGAEIGVLLPFSRKHESEADVIGMMMMAKAGYPPAEGIDLWDRMAGAGGPQPLPFLSTHPTNERRQEVMAEWLPKANKRFQRNELPTDTTVARWTGEVAPAGRDQGRVGKALVPEDRRPEERSEPEDDRRREKPEAPREKPEPPEDDGELSRPR